MYEYVSVCECALHNFQMQATVQTHTHKQTCNVLVKSSAGWTSTATTTSAIIHTPLFTHMHVRVCVHPYIHTHAIFIYLPVHLFVYKVHKCVCIFFHRHIFARLPACPSVHTHTWGENLC